MDKNTIFVQMPEIRIMEMPGGTGVKYRNHLHTLNNTAYEIFDLCDGHRTVEDIEAVMCFRYPENDIEGYIEAFLQELLSLGLVREKNGHDFVRIIR